MTDIPLALEQRFVQTAIDQWGLDSRFHHVTNAVRISGPLRLDLLTNATRELTLAYPVFRTRVSDDGLTQRTHPEPVSVRTLDVSGMSDDEVAELFSRNATRPFDLATEDPVKITVGIRQENEVFLTFAGHHMFFDATGLDIALAKTLQIYEGLLSGSWTRGSEDGVPDYLSYVRDQPAEMNSDRTANKLAYWRKALDGAESVLHYPERGADPYLADLIALPFRLGTQQSAELVEYARQCRVTPFTLITGAALAALSEVSDQDDICMAAVTDTRTPGYRNCIGQFADLFPLRRRITRDLDEKHLKSLFATLCKDKYHELPSEYLRRRIDWLERRTSFYGISEVFVNYITERALKSDFPGVAGHEISRLPLIPQANDEEIRYHGLPLGFQLIHQPDGLAGALTYDAGVMSERVADTIQTAFVANLNRLRDT